jgi:DNA helicase II / ATP-dependent DNA helicase PcrA
MRSVDLLDGYGELRLVQTAQGDRHVYASRTRFIPAALLQHFETNAWPLATAESGGRLDPRQLRVDVGARMRGMWR